MMTRASDLFLMAAVSHLLLAAAAESQGVSFIVRTDFRVGNSPGSVAVGDFDGDGKPDLAVVDSGSANVSVLLGNGDGSFQAAQDFGVGRSPNSVAVGDVNGDGRPDLAVANWVSNNVSILINNTPMAKQRSNGKK